MPDATRHLSGQWLTRDGYFLAVMGVHDPDGVYATFRAEYPEGTPRPGVDQGIDVGDKDIGAHAASEEAHARAVGEAVGAAAKAAFAEGSRDRRTKELPGDAPQARGGVVARGLWFRGACVVASVHSMWDITLGAWTDGAAGASSRNRGCCRVLRSRRSVV